MVYSRLLLMDICWFFGWCFFLDQIFAFVKVVLSPHAALSCGNSRTPSTLSSCRRPSSIWRAWIVEIIEVVEHQIHVLFFVNLQMVDYPLIFVNLDSDVGIRLS